MRKGHVAVGTTRKAAPYGTILYCPDAVDHLLIVVDCGPGVNGRDRLDICLPDVGEYLAFDKAGLSWAKRPCWILGSVSNEQAR